MAAGGRPYCSGMNDFTKLEIQTIFVPALISLILYLVLSYAILPFYHRHRQRYAQYLPLETLSTQTGSLRGRVLGGLTRFVLPTSWRNHWNPPQGRYAVDNGSLFDDEEGEGMVGFDMNSNEGGGRERGNEAHESGPRLSRELEEGFQDDSDEEARDPNRGTR